VIAKNDHEQVFVLQKFALLLVQELQLLQELLVLQQVRRVQVVPVLQLVQMQLLVLAVFHHVVHLQLVHLLKKSKKKMNLKNLGYKF
jgi:hypothetical protein